MHYIMSPDLFNSLCNVRGFNDLNGKTYNEHITIILGKFLDNETKKSILNSETPEVSLKLLPFEYTHEYMPDNK